MDTARLMVGTSILASGGLLIGINAVRVLRATRDRSRRPSTDSVQLPFIGPCLAILGHLVLPIPYARYVLLTLLLDPTTWLWLRSLPSWWTPSPRPSLMSAESVAASIGMIVALLCIDLGGARVGPGRGSQLDSAVLQLVGAFLLVLSILTVAVGLRRTPGHS